jgi:hypothetical protein
MGSSIVWAGMEKDADRWIFETGNIYSGDIS